MIIRDLYRVQPNFRIRLKKGNGNLSLELCSLATEGTQEFPPLKRHSLDTEGRVRKFGRTRRTNKES